MRTPDAMSSEAREVVLEVYLNGVLYSADSYFTLDDKDVQLEFEISDAIYNIYDIYMTLQIETNDQVSVRYCSLGEMHLQLEVNEIKGISVCEVNDLQLEMNRNDGEAEKNRPTESSAGQMFKKMKAFSQRICAFPRRKTKKSVGQPEVDDLDPEESCVPDPRAPEPEPEMDLVYTEQFCIPESDLVAPPEMDLGTPPEMDLVAPPEPKLDTVDPEESYVSPKESTAGQMFKKKKAFSQRICTFLRRKRQKSVGQPEVDLLDPEESCVPDPRAPEPEPEMDLVNTEQFCIPEKDLVAPPEPKMDAVDPKEPYVIPKESTKMTKIKKVHGFVMTKKAGYATVRNIKKISIAARPEMHLTVHEPEAEEDPVAPSVAPKWHLVDAVDLYSPGSSIPEPEPEMDLVDTEQFCIPESDLVAPPEPKLDTVDPEESYVSPKERTAGRMFKKMKAFSQRISAFPRRKMKKSVGQPEVDLLDPEESCVPDPRAPEPEPEMDLVDTEQFCIPEKDLVAPPEPKMDAVDPKEPYVIPKESTKMMKIKKVHGFVMTKKAEYATVRNIKKISIAARPEMHLSVPEPEREEDPVAPKWDLVDAVDLYSPGSSVPEPEPECEWDELYVPGPRILQPKWDLAVPDPVSKANSELSRLEKYIPLNVFQLEYRLKQCPPLKQRHVSNVWSRVFIGDEEIATDRDVLREMCITHILNAAAPKKDLKYYLGTYNNEDIAGSVNTGSRYYRGLRINYYSLPTADKRCSDISEYFMPASRFIDKALDKRESKVLVCCKQGVEHSATLFLAYLMICHDMMLEEAIDHVIKWRRIGPSRDALKKLMLLNADLVQKRKLKLQDVIRGRNRKKWQLKKKLERRTL